MRGEPTRWAVGAAIGVLVVLVLAALAAALTYSPLFAADLIRVEGAGHLAGGEVAEAAGLHIGTNVFHLDVGAAEARLASDPWIEGATVVRRLPSTVVVRVVERRPMVVAGGDVFAEDGTVLPGAPAEGMPIVMATIGEVAVEEAEAAAAAIASLSPAVRRQVGFVMVGLDGSLEIRLAGGLSVRWGTGLDHRAKAASLDAFLSYADAEGRVPVRVDVSVPGAPSANFAS